jgi:hypothetical protein
MSQERKSAMKMEMDLDEVRQCMRLLLEHVAKRGIKCVDAAAADMYWTTTSDEWLVTPAGEPTLAVGSLHDDILELRRLLLDPEGASSIDLVRLASVLRLLSIQLVRAPIS